LQYKQIRIFMCMLDSKVVFYAKECRFGFIFSKLAAPCCI